MTEENMDAQMPVEGVDAEFIEEAPIWMQGKEQVMSHFEQLKAAALAFASKKTFGGNIDPKRSFYASVENKKNRYTASMQSKLKELVDADDELCGRKK